MLDAAGQQASAVTALSGLCAAGALASTAGVKPAYRLPTADPRLLDTPEERNRIARQLHDAVSQTLFAANLLAGVLARSTDNPSEVVRAQAAVLERLNRSALAEMRMMLFELQPEALVNVRMPELLQLAVDVLVGRGGITVTTDINDAAPLPTAQRTQAYRIAQAALSNIARHSGANHAHVHWSTSYNCPTVLRVRDDGCGFDDATDRPGLLGIAQMHHRAALLGAHLRITSAPGEGTEIFLTLNRSELNQ